jgi:hypothetical protein
VSYFLSTLRAALSDDTEDDCSKIRASDNKDLYGLKRANVAPVVL